MRPIAPFAAAALLAACAPTPPPVPAAPKPMEGPPASLAQAPVRADFICDDGRRFSVAFTDDQAIVSLEDGAVLTLRAEPVGSGYGYAADGFELRGKGAEARWSAPGVAPVRCADVTQSK